MHAGCIEDMWQVAIEIASRAGGDRGCLGLTGAMTPPAAQKPQRLMVLETEGFARLDEPTKQAFAQLLEQIERAGVTLVTRRTSAAVEAMERAIGNATAVASGITGWENRWGTRNLVDQHPDGVSERAKAVLAKSEAMSVSDYRALLLEREHRAADARAVWPTSPTPRSRCHAPAPRRSGPATSPASRCCRARRATPSSTIQARCCSRLRDRAAAWRSAACRSACN